ITRQKKAKDYSYSLGEEIIKDENRLKRIKSLVIPLGWEYVYICALENRHQQATGADLKMCKQYRYHPSWNAILNRTKFYRQQEFRKAIPTINLQLEKYLSLTELTHQKVLATVVSLIKPANIGGG
ncbi:MAG: DNA topoisomerase IB, partial [Ferruginibacter sp.]